MCSESRAACTCSALLVALVACGNYSDEDIPFLEAVPTQVSMTLPLGGEAACANPSALAAAAQSEGTNINGGIARAVTLLDLVLQQSPTARTATARTWGPFPDRAHPGFELQITMSQTPGQLQFDIEIQEAPKDGPFTGILDGQLVGATAVNGSGSLRLHFDALRELGISQPGDPKNPMTVAYDFTSDPKTIGLTIATGDALGSLPGFSYAWSGFANGNADFTYEVVTAGGGTLKTTPAQFTAQGAGSAVVTYQPLTGAATQLTECWDDAFCIDYLDDPTNVTQDCQSSPCDLGSQSRCVNLQ